MWRGMMIIGIIQVNGCVCLAHCTGFHAAGPPRLSRLTSPRSNAKNVEEAGGAFDESAEEGTAMGGVRLDFAIQLRRVAVHRGFSDQRSQKCDTVNSSEICVRKSHAIPLRGHARDARLR
jgi:hypothetical protein